MVAHMRLEPQFPDVWDVACSPTEPTIACASSASQSQSKAPLHVAQNPMPVLHPPFSCRMSDWALENVKSRLQRSRLGTSCDHGMPCLGPRTLNRSVKSGAVTHSRCCR